MAPKRSNKGKDKLVADDKIVFRTPGMSSIGQRVAFSRKIEGADSNDGGSFEPRDPRDSVTKHDPCLRG
ncbi:hypothetical protein E3N88_44613 [Mikania micrantha]|uniref:Uncharacterized protein n=1 Tax=Mikania micrantha TaxID=192012 RepID=A0A5N6LBJ3_9ASTR|nr:hypothetical protein E3N88_44613 [Mikania micrantha]